MWLWPLAALYLKRSQTLARRGITDPEQFIDWFCRIAVTDVVRYLVGVLDEEERIGDLARLAARDQLLSQTVLADLALRRAAVTAARGVPISDLSEREPDGVLHPVIVVV